MGGLDEQVKSDIRSAIMNDKVTACPIAVRLAWHASGTYDNADGSGGSDGATMRFAPESTDGANAGLSIPRALLKAVQEKNPHLSEADIWTLAGSYAIEFSGGPSIPHVTGRTDAADGSGCPANGRLPDASQGAQHLRDVFYRQGFNDQEIVALSGAHTLGRCHLTRSGFDGPWTSNPLKFDNEYFTNLLENSWSKKSWDGPSQFEDESGTLMMLPTDIALTTDDAFLPWVEKYAADEDLFFCDFTAAYAKLLSNGTSCDPTSYTAPDVSEQDQASADFRNAAMHGSLGPLKAFAAKADVFAVENETGRSALHKAAFWAHEGSVDYLANELKLSPNQQDSKGDTPLHDAARLGHAGTAAVLIAAGADKTIANGAGETPADVAKEGTF